MAQAKEGVPSKLRIESLSDLIFGLALSIGALTLIGQEMTDFVGLLNALLFYGFSFLILISVWYGYSRTMTVLRLETDRLAALNVLLLFLVSIEPFLFEQMLHSSLMFVENASIVYALDLGGLFGIQAVLANTISADKDRPKEVLRAFRLRRNTMLISMTLFFISAIPIFWSWTIPTSSTSGIPLRIIIWLIPLFLPPVRRSWEHREKAKPKPESP
jgi:uncharacterized membrane protein